VVAFNRPTGLEEEAHVKTKVLGVFGAALLMMASVPEAKAAVCARGVYRAGCAGPRGAVVVRKPVHHCIYRGGARVCR
jgi:hypothetical protein